MASSSSIEFDSSSVLEDSDDTLKEKWHLLELEHAKYSQYETLNSIIEVVIKTPNLLEPETNKKVGNILMATSCEQFMVGDQNILGITQDHTKTQLNRFELSEIRNIVQQKLEEKYKSLKELSRVNNTLNKAQFNIEEFEERIGDLISQQKIYITKLKEYSKLTDELKFLKSQKLVNNLNNRLEECSIHLKLNKLQTEIMKDKFKIDELTETQESLQAYENFVQDLKQQIHETRNEVEALKQLKMEYEAVDCREYRGLLESYLKLIAELENMDSLTLVCDESNITKQFSKLL